MSYVSRAERGAALTCTKGVADAVSLLPHVLHGHNKAGALTDLGGLVWVNEVDLLFYQTLYVQEAMRSYLHRGGGNVG